MLFRTFVFSMKFYLETQCRSTLLYFSWKKSRKAREPARKGKDFPIETGPGRKKEPEQQEAGTPASCRLRHRCRLGPPESIKS